MAITLAAPARTVPTGEFLLRVMGGFDETPNLRLTTKQAMRLWELDQPMCEAVLETLIDAQFLQRDQWGQFVKSQASY